MSGRVTLLSVALAAVSAAGLAAAGPALASTPTGSATVAVNSATAGLLAQVLVEVPMTYSCGPMDSFTDNESEVDVQQAVSGGRVATGEGHFGQAVPICDGAPHTIKIQVLPTAGLHFHTGLAIVQATFALAGESAGSFVFERATIPWQKIRFRRVSK